jgi:hypothetical protein
VFIIYLNVDALTDGVAEVALGYRWVCLLTDFVEL